MDLHNIIQPNCHLLHKDKDSSDSWENSDEIIDPKLKPVNGCINATLILKAKQEFHSRRFLRLKYLPTDVCEEDIRQLVHPLEIKDVLLNRISQTAKVIPMLPESLEVWPGDKEYSLRDHKVIATPSSTEGMLCVAHLPLVYTEQEFSNLVQMYGPVAHCFLFRSEKTGEYKGYGFVEYSSKEVAYKAKSLLDKKCIGDCTLHCNWLDSSHVSYSSLHSKCLFVDHLPPNYRDLVEFRKIFSVNVSPSYCQIALKNGQPLGFGLVEFENPSDAESTQMQLNHYQIEEYKIRVTYCIPGYRAMVIYNKLTSELASNGKKPLLPDPPLNSTAFGQLQTLAMQNPQLFQNLQNIVSSQLNGSSSRNGFGEKHNGAKSPQSGLLGSLPSPDTSPSSTSSSSSSSPSFGQMNPNVQAALVLLLATQMQFQMGVQQPSLLGNPQLLSLVQTFLKQQIGMKNTSYSMQNSMPLLPDNGQNHPPNTMNNTRQLDSNSKDDAAGEALCRNGNSWANRAANGNGNWQPHDIYARKHEGNGPAPFKPHKVPLLPNPPMNTKCETGLLPTPDSGKMSNRMGNAHGGTNLGSALHNGHTKFHFNKGLLDLPDNCNDKPMTNGSLLMSKSVFNGHGQKIPLLGNKPGAMPIHSSSVNGCHPSAHNGTTHDRTDDVTNSSYSPTAPSHPLNPLSDSNAVLQQILPLILSQPQLFLNELSKSQAQGQVAPTMNAMTSVSSHQQQPPLSQTVAPNHTIPLTLNTTNQNGNGLIFGSVPPSPIPVHSQSLTNAHLAVLAQLQQQMQVQGVTPAMMGLLLQMSQGLDATKNGNDGLQQIPQPVPAPQANHQPHKYGFQNHNGYSQANGHLGNLLPQTSGKLLFPNPIPPVSALMALSNGKAPSFVGFSPSTFMVPTPQLSPPNITQLMAEIQQRGSLLGDFRQAMQGDVSTLYSPQCNGKLPIARPTVGNLGSPLNGKRKLHVLLPTPETSPEGCYISQHSQGIGGHFAESYRKKRHT